MIFLHSAVFTEKKNSGKLTGGNSEKVKTVVKKKYIMISSLDDGWICSQQSICIVVAVIVVAACSACVFWHHDGLKLGPFIQSVLLLEWVHYYGIQYEFLY